MDNREEGFAPILIILILAFIVLVFVSILLGSDNNTKIVQETIAPSKSLPTDSASPPPQAIPDFLSFDEIKAFMPKIVWEETVEEVIEVYISDRLNVDTNELSGLSSFSSQTNIRVNDYIRIIDEQLTDNGWQQASGADGPTGGMFGYMRESNGIRRYVEFKHVNCKAAGIELGCPGVRDGNTVFYSYDF